MLLRIKPSQPVTEIAFEFDRDSDLEGWRDFRALNCPTVKDGVLTMRLGGRDPYFSCGPLRIPADKHATIRLRMKISACQPTAELFWATADEPSVRDDKYMKFPINPDGQWHEYEVPVGEHKKWRGQVIRAIRLDPTVEGAEPGAMVHIDRIVGE